MIPIELFCLDSEGKFGSDLPFGSYPSKQPKEAVPIKSIISRVFIGVFAACFAALSAAALAVPVQSEAPKQTIDNVTQSACGKIFAVANDGFLLDVKVGDTSSTLQFITDAKTKVTGSLSVGAKVSVEYRTDTDGRNIATAVVVQS